MSWSRFVLVMLVLLSMEQFSSAAPADGKPLMKDFMGLSVHSKGFEPEPYWGVCTRVRDYHSLYWDIGKDPATPTRFPKGAVSEGEGWLNWGDSYSSWVKAGLRVDACIIWNAAQIPPASWTDIPTQAYAYGKSFSDCFGSRGMNIVEAAEIGGEMGSYDAKAYHEIFRYMAKGLRASDPAMKIVTCTSGVQGDALVKSLDSFTDVADLFDAISVRQFAAKRQQPVWEYSFPEDPGMGYVDAIQKVIDYRNQHLPGKEVWLTSFGYDACTQQAPSDAASTKCKSLSDLAQARYIVRSFLVLSALDLNRAYLFYFNDNDDPAVHGSSGITRRGTPKPSFHAMRHLYQTLGEYRFAAVVRQDKVIVYKYVHGGDAKDCIFVAWSPTQGDQVNEEAIDLPAKPSSVQRMPTADGAVPTVTADGYQAGKLVLPIDGSPLYIRVRLP